MPPHTFRPVLLLLQLIRKVDVVRRPPVRKGGELIMSIRRSGFCGRRGFSRRDQVVVVVRELPEHFLPHVQRGLEICDLGIHSHEGIALAGEAHFLAIFTLDREVVQRRHHGEGVVIVRVVIHRVVARLHVRFPFAVVPRLGIDLLTEGDHPYSIHQACLSHVVVTIALVLHRRPPARPAVEVLFVVLHLHVVRHPIRPARAVRGQRAPHLLEHHPERVQPVPQAREVPTVPRPEGGLGGGMPFEGHGHGDGRVHNPFREVAVVDESLDQHGVVRVHDDVQHAADVVVHDTVEGMRHEELEHRAHDVVAQEPQQQVFVLLLQLAVSRLAPELDRRGHDLRHEPEHREPLDAKLRHVLPLPCGLADELREHGSVLQEQFHHLLLAFHDVRVLQVVGFDGSVPLHGVRGPQESEEHGGHGNDDRVLAPLRPEERQQPLQGPSGAQVRPQRRILLRDAGKDGRHVLARAAVLPTLQRVQQQL
mmetsp:Transcript_13261/g.37695  ORF Transcript_13261/g.37695 Transcript_13261/m.37695 type:complete len:479 (+) Transcript_13261:185-1621(+)